MEARFWVYHTPADGFVRLKVRPGRPLTVTHGGSTEEGYHWEEDRYTVDGDTLTLEAWTSERDCDGRLDTERRCWVRLDMLDAFGVDPKRPLWRTEYGRQRDYTAEASGY